MSNQLVAPFSSASAMSKQQRDSPHIRNTKVKKVRGVGSCVIAILDSDEELPPVTTNDYARVMKTRVGTFGQVEKVAMSSVPISKAEWVNICDLLEANGSVDTVAENVICVVPAKRWKRANDSMSILTFQTANVAKELSDQNALLGQHAICCA